MQRSCEYCGRPFHAFPSDVAGGRGRFCSRACAGAYQTATAPGQDREKVLARKRRYRERHQDEERARNKRWRDANKDQLRASGAAWRAAHPGEGYEGVKRWRSENPDLQAAAARAAACNRRAKEAGIAGHIARADITALWARQPACIRCGQGRGVDHIVSFRDGGTNSPDNLQNLCRDCNALKEAKISPAIAETIRAAYEAGERDRKVLSRRFGITPGSVWLVVKGKTWAPEG